MFREIGHFLWHAPGTLALLARSTQTELYEQVMGEANAAGLADRRRQVVSDLAGNVLEIGCGTGMMFEHYGAGAHVTAIEPDDAFRERARERVNAMRARIELAAGDATHLAYPDASFDALVFGLVLCSVPTMEGVLAEARRVLRPGGQLRLVEHVKSEGRVAGALMDAFDPLWLKLNGQGCHMNRDPLSAIRGAGFEIEGTSAFQLFESRLPAFPMVVIRARG